MAKSVKHNFNNIYLSFELMVIEKLNMIYFGKILDILIKSADQQYGPRPLG